MLRRRLDFLGKMALSVAHDCAGHFEGLPAIFCSRHGDLSRSVTLLSELATQGDVSPTSFSLSVHNAIGSLFSIARRDRSNQIAISGDSCAVESAILEACALLTEEDRVLLVVYDCPLPDCYRSFADEVEAAYAWAWLIEPPKDDVIDLLWSQKKDDAMRASYPYPVALEPLRFLLSDSTDMTRSDSERTWRWSRHV